MRRKRKVRTHRALKLIPIKKTLEVGCCKTKRCLEMFSAEEITQWRKIYWQLKEDERRQYLLMAFTLNTYHEGHMRKYSFEYNGKSLCPTGWYRALGISNGWYERTITETAFLHAHVCVYHAVISKVTM